MFFSRKNTDDLEIVPLESSSTAEILDEATTVATAEENKKLSDAQSIRKFYVGLSAICCTFFCIIGGVSSAQISTEGQGPVIRTGIEFALAAIGIAVMLYNIFKPLNIHPQPPKSSDRIGLLSPQRTYTHL